MWFHRVLPDLGAARDDLERAPQRQRQRRQDRVGHPAEQVRQAGARQPPPSAQRAGSAA
jgi:hypothetical protein